MVQIRLKAKHYYYIVHYLRNSSVQQYFSLINRLKITLNGNNDLDAFFDVSANVVEVIDMFKTLTVLPEGQANKINTEMDDLLMPQIVLGMADEQAAGIGPDADGNLPDNAYWQIIAKGIAYAKGLNTAAKENAIIQGKSFIDNL
jgi:hypothetical protein